jgi:hypothetical protein
MLECRQTRKVNKGNVIEQRRLTHSTGLFTEQGELVPMHRIPLHLKIFTITIYATRNLTHPEHFHPDAEISLTPQSLTVTTNKQRLVSIGCSLFRKRFNLDAS